MKTVAEYIKAKREALGLSAREVAKNAGVTGEHIRYIESGQRKTPSFDVVMKILSALHVDLQEFLQETGYLPANVEPASLRKLKQIPVISWATAGEWHEVYDSFQPGDADEWIVSDVRGRHVFALRVKGDSMEPEFHEGEIIIINPHIEAKPGDFVIVKNDDTEEATFKQLKKYGDTLVLHPLNPRYPDIELKKGYKYRIVGKVVKKEKKY
jgi:SOS-response transcriptional repressor LexA